MEAGNVGIGWKPIRMEGWTNPQVAEFALPEEGALKRREEVQEHEPPLAAAERALTAHWREEVPVGKFAAALRAMAEALSQEQIFSFTVDHRLMLMRPIGTPSIEYSERENERKEVIFRYTWEA